MRLTIISLLIITLFPWSSLRIQEKQETSVVKETDSGAFVCPPDIYFIPPDECVPLGPSEFISNGLEQGIIFPISPLPGYTPDGSLNSLPYHYYKVTGEGTPLYASLDNAKSNISSGNLSPGLLYTSYIDYISTDQGAFFLLRSGYWINNNGARASYATFQGLLFSSQPSHSFGWVLTEAKSRVAPGNDSPETGKSWKRYNLVQVYDTTTVDGLTWNLVGPDEWLSSQYVARVDPHTDPPEGVTGNRWIEVNLFEQTIAVYDNDRLVFATLASTGVSGLWTRPGLFQIYEKDSTYNMSGSTAADNSDYYYLEDVPWTMYFDQRRALHGAYWHNAFGYTRSHGCVNLSVGDSHWLYDWANIGDFVYVFDPSGNTPTDSTSYGTGAP